METLNYIGAIFTLIFGIVAFILPNQFAKLIFLTPVENKGTTEIRSTYGGLVMGLGGYALWSQSEMVFQCLAAGWFAIAAARVLSTRIDNSYNEYTLVFIVIEFGIGLLCFV